MDYNARIDGKKLKFESEIFGIKIAHIDCRNGDDIGQIMAKSKKMGFDYAVSQVDLEKKNLIDDMLQSGFRIYGFPITLARKLSSGKYKSDANIRLHKKNDISSLKKMSKGAFREVHWYYDSRLDPKKVDHLYVKWIENSCKGRSSAVFVYEKDDEVLGYVACNEQGNAGIIDIIAVAAKARGMGIGKNLVDCACLYFKKKGLTEAKVKTDIRNLDALNLYKKCGFETEKITANLNKWLK